MAKCAEDPNRVPCGIRRDPGLSQRPLEQMGSISYFVTHPFYRCAMSFSRAPTHLAIYFVVIYISRLNVPPPLRAERIYVTHDACTLILFSFVAFHPRSSLPFYPDTSVHTSLLRFLPASRHNNATISSGLIHRLTDNTNTLRSLSRLKLAGVMERLSFFTLVTRPDEKNVKDRRDSIPIRPDG